MRDLTECVVQSTQAEIAAAAPVFPSRLDLAQFEIAKQCDRQCFPRMCHKIGLLAPVYVDPLSTIPPRYEQSQWSDISSNNFVSNHAFINHTDGSVSDDSLIDHINDSVSNDSSIDHNLASDSVDVEAAPGIVDLSMPSVSTAPPASGHPSIESVTHSMAVASLMDDRNGKESITTLLHGLTRNFFYVPGQVFNTKFVGRQRKELETDNVAEPLHTSWVLCLLLSVLDNLTLLVFPALIWPSNMLST
jgi:hypothetical protein